MEKLAAMYPAFLRFPGGNYLEGDHIPDRFDWKKTIGPLVVPIETKLENVSTRLHYTASQYSIQVLRAIGCAARNQSNVECPRHALAISQMPLIAKQFPTNASLFCSSGTQNALCMDDRDTTTKYFRASGAPVSPLILGFPAVHSFHSLPIC
jgi:hypothetical protein